jgi:hypothetical protein
VSIEVSGGGSLVVTTEELLDAQQRLGRLAARGDELCGRLGRAAAAAATTAPELTALLARAERELDAVARGARRLAAELEQAAAEYGWAERTALAKQRLLGLLLGPGLLVNAAALLAAVDASRAGGPDFGDPRLVAVLRGLADSLSLTVLLAAVQALPGREFEETPVRVSRAGGGPPPAAPAGFADLAKRVPAAGAGAPQLRVERYVLPGGEVHWILYSAGTADWGPVPAAEPWDLTSDVVGVAGGSAGSSRAAVLALRAAGWRPGEPVLPVGHSQGGIVATGLAASGLASAPLLVTFGSPTAGVPPPPGATDVAVEHSDDPVPALGGSPPAFGDRRLLVREAAPVTASAAAGGGSALGAHAMSGYRRTAREMDASSDERLVAARTTLREFTGGQTAEVTFWRGERVSADRPRGSGGGR